MDAIIGLACAFACGFTLVLLVLWYLAAAERDTGHALKAAGIVPTAAVAPEPVEPQEAQA